MHRSNPLSPFIKRTFGGMNSVSTKICTAEARIASLDSWPPIANPIEFSIVLIISVSRLISSNGQYIIRKLKPASITHAKSPLFDCLRSLEFHFPLAERFYRKLKHRDLRNYPYFILAPASIFSETDVFRPPPSRTQVNLTLMPLFFAFPFFDRPNLFASNLFYHFANLGLYFPNLRCIYWTFVPHAISSSAFKTSPFTIRRKTWPS